MFMPMGRVRGGEVPRSWVGERRDLSRAGWFGESKVGLFESTSFPNVSIIFILGWWGLELKNEVLQLFVACFVGTRELHLF